MNLRILSVAAAAVLALSVTASAQGEGGLDDPLYLLISESDLTFPDFSEPFIPQESAYEFFDPRLYQTVTIVTMGQFGPPIALPTPGFTAATSFDTLPTGLATDGREILFLGGLSDESLSEHVFMGVKEGDDPGSAEPETQTDIVLGLEGLPGMEPGLGAIGGVASGVMIGDLLDAFNFNFDALGFTLDGSMTTLSAGMAEETIHAFTPAAGFTGLIALNNQGGLQAIITPVPEPSAVALICAGALALVVRRRRRRA